VSASAQPVAPLATELAAAGGTGAPASATARLRGLLLRALAHGRAELAKPRSGYEAPVPVAVASTPTHLLAATPAPAALRADPDADGERTWLLLAAATGALVELAEPPPPAAPGDLGLLAGELGDGFLVLALPAAPVRGEVLEELAPLAFAEHAEGIDRLRALAVAVPAALLGEPELREPIGAAHPLRVAEAVARLGRRPTDGQALLELGDAVIALVDPAGGGPEFRPHEDPDPGRRVARRILQRLNGMGKWGGYHTDIAHLARGFAGNDRQLAVDVGEALLASGLLAEKPSVGQRHVFLNPRRARDVHRLIETGQTPPDLHLPG